MEFDFLSQPVPRSRYSTVAKNGMVCSSNPLASSAGLEILKKGGNAVDAAIATAAVLTVVEPTSSGIGGDAFAIVWMNNNMYGLNASGYTPKNLCIDTLKNQGYKEIPKNGWIPVTIPGEPKAWAELSKLFGKLELIEVLQPAIDYAENGFPLSPVTAHLWEKYTKRHKEEYKNNPVFKEWFKVFTKNGEPYRCGDIIKFPDHAKSLKLIGESYSDAFYYGEIADAFVSQSYRDGGFVTKEDLEDYRVEWVDPISINYRGYDVWEIPPNGQGLVTLIALNILKNFEFRSRSFEEYHIQLEAMKIAFHDALSIVTDEKFMTQDYRYLLTEEYGKKMAQLISINKCFVPEVNTPRSGTVYLSTADQHGNMVSYIQSNYLDFGSGVVLENYGISLQNRGFDFSLNKDSIHALFPRKRCYHTIIPAFITKDNQPIGPLGVMGGYMQPQGHVQVVMNLIDYHLNPQAALDQSRWQWKEGKKIVVEPDFDPAIVRALQNLGHEVKIENNSFSFGRAELIVRQNNGVFVGATESRADGSVSCY